MFKLYQGDCLNEMKKIENYSVDMIFTDLPYGTTQNAWDKKIPLEPLWEEYKRVLKTGGVILLFAQMPFAADLVYSNRKWFRYEWIWEKSNPVGFLNANRMPLRSHENILVFYEKLPKYIPQKEKRDKPIRIKSPGSTTTNYGKFNAIDKVTTTRYPRDCIKFNNSNNKNKFHPTEKPIDLLEYMIKTYTTERNTVLDSCMGSGSCGVACQHLGRNFIGIEKDITYFQKAKARIENAIRK